MMHMVHTYTSTCIVAFTSNSLGHLTLARKLMKQLEDLQILAAWINLR